MPHFDAQDDDVDPDYDEVDEDDDLDDEEGEEGEEEEGTWQVSRAAQQERGLTLLG